MSDRVLKVHYVLPDDYSEDIPTAICGEKTRLSIIEGKNRHIRHVYVTLSYGSVNCKVCQQYVNMLLLSEVDL